MTRKVRDTADNIQCNANDHLRDKNEKNEKMTRNIFEKVEISKICYPL